MSKASEGSIDAHIPPPPEVYDPTAGIIVGFSRPKGVFMPILAWLIMFFDRRDYSHVYVKWYSKKFDEWIHYEADTSGVRFVGSKAFEEQRTRIVEYELPPMTDRKKLVKYALKNAGSSYPVWHLVGIAWAQLVEKLCGRDIKNIFSGEESVCSKLVILILEILEYDIRYTDKQLNKARPSDVEDLVKAILDRGKGGEYVL